MGKMAPAARRGWRERMRRHLCRVATAVVLVGLGSVAAGCSGARGELGTSDSPCYVALPTATEAVGHTAHLDGVRLMKVSSLPYPRLGIALRGQGVTSGRVCLVAFTGTFSSASVSHPSGRSTGHLAVVVLRYPGGGLISTVLFRKSPVHFGHSHLG